MMRESTRGVYRTWIPAILLLAALSGYALTGTAHAQPNVNKDEQVVADSMSLARDYLNQGIKAFTDQKYDVAAQFFQQAIGVEPDYPEDTPRIYLATAYMLQFVPGSTDPKNKLVALKAIKTFGEVVDRSELLGKPNVNAMLAIANINNQLRNDDLTREWCNRVLELEAKTDDDRKCHAEAEYRLAAMIFNKVQEQTGVLGEKVQSYEQEDRLEILKDIDEGLRHLQRAIEIRPDYFDAMMYRNLLLREKAKLTEDEEIRAKLVGQADADFKKAVQLKLDAEAKENAQRKRLNIGE
jgi:tetratricopeptide (TPR) repeat protein